MKRLLLLPVLAIICVTVAAETVIIQLPPETSAYKPGKNVELAQTFCLNCHSADYTSMQPTMPRKFWEATVKKMKEKYGAPLPPDTSALVEYLTTTYGKP